MVGYLWMTMLPPEVSVFAPAEPDRICPVGRPRHVVVERARRVPDTDPEVVGAALVIDRHLELVVTRSVVGAEALVLRFLATGDVRDDQPLQ